MAVRFFNRSGKKSVIVSIVIIVITLLFAFGLLSLEMRTKIYASLGAIVLGIICVSVTRYIKKNKSKEEEDKYCTEDEKSERKKRDIVFEIIDSVGLGLFLAAFITLSRSTYGYTFLSGGFLPFWEISLILGAVVGVIAFLWLRKTMQKTSLQLALAAIALILSAFVFSLVITHLNYVLDYSEPEEYRSIIEDKDYTRRRKRADTYEFTVTVDGKQYDIDVPKSVYNSYDVGDRFNFKKYKGFFGKEFFMFD